MPRTSANAREPAVAFSICFTRDKSSCNCCFCISKASSAFILSSSENLAPSWEAKFILFFNNISFSSIALICLDISLEDNNPLLILYWFVAISSDYLTKLLNVLL